MVGFVIILGEVHLFARHASMWLNSVCKRTEDAFCRAKVRCTLVLKSCRATVVCISNKREIIEEEKLEEEKLEGEN